MTRCLTFRGWNGGHINQQWEPRFRSLRRSIYDGKDLPNHGCISPWQSRFDLYGVGIAAGNAGLKLPIEQSGQVFRGEMLRRIGWDFFLGLRFWAGSSDITLRRTSEIGPRPAPPSDSGLHTALRALGLRIHGWSISRPLHVQHTTGVSANASMGIWSCGVWWYR
jgi:hypothetical protein